MIHIIKEFIDFMGDVYPTALWIRNLIFAFLGIFSIHRLAFFLIGLFGTRKFKPANTQHSYAILIPARNEESVIANLLESIAKQDYPSEKITTFVVADNCTDHTADIARAHGAVCYERFDDQRRTKGFALQFLFGHIEEDYGIQSFDGYFIFDSDNLLNKDYVTRMNESFDAGEKIITSYRNTKNFDENWVASTYALHWLRSIRSKHRARSVLRLATNIQGTGFLFASELVKDGWNYTSLTEDRAFTADAVAHGYMISYNDAAMFYDEQPTSLRIAFRQRIRWSKGHLQAFVETGWPLFRNIFVGSRKLNWEKSTGIWDFLWKDLRYRFASFDTLSQLIPFPIIRIVFWVLVSWLLHSFFLYENGIQGVDLFSKGGLVGDALQFFFGTVYIQAAPGLRAMIVGSIVLVFWRWCGMLWVDLKNIPIAVYVFIAERKRIKKISIWKKIFYCCTWPIFDIIYRYSMYLAIFMKVTWKQIPHTSKVTIEDLEKVTVV